MKRNFLYLFLGAVLFSCGSNKSPETRGRFLKGFTAQNNTLFNAKEALNTELESREKAYKDNFYSGYISLVKYNDPSEGLVSSSSSFSGGSNANVPSIPNTGGVPPASPGTNTTGVKGASILEIAEGKALKTIHNYSVMRKGLEKNDQIFDAYMVLIKSRIYQNKPIEALDAFGSLKQIMPRDKRMPLAIVYEGLAYTKLKDYHKANSIFTELKKQNISKKYDKVLSVFNAENLILFDKKDQAIAELDRAFALNSDRPLKSRISFLKGQLLSEKGKNVEARTAFLNAYKYANDFEFEVKSQIEIAKTYNSKDDYEGARKYLENISKKGTYASRKNEFYYALGLMANKVGKKQEALDYFRKSLKEKVSDSQIRGLDYYEIGKHYLEKDDYITAGAYYDSALVAMTHAPTKILLKEQSDNIKKLSKNYYLIKKNDSILALAAMPEADRTAFFQKYINTLKAKEELAERERKLKERNAGFDNSDFSKNSIFGNSGNNFQDFGTGTKGFYFNNQNTVAKGTSSFKQIWGDRALSDNWRFSAKMATLVDTKNSVMGTSSAPDPRRYEPAFYIEKIPTDLAQLDQLKKDRDTASLGLGIMYDNLFSNRPLATKTLYKLVDNKPVEDVMLKALYQIFWMNYEKNPEIAERAKNILINDYPYSSYAEFARNPRGSNFLKSAEAVESAYLEAYQLYKDEKYAEGKLLVEKTLKDHPKDALVPKLSLLNAFLTGKLSGKEIMILQLEQIVLNYAKTDEGKKAKEMLNYLKSDIKLQMMDNKGNPIQQPNNNLPKAAPPATSGGLFNSGNSGAPPVKKNADLNKKINTSQNLETIDAQVKTKK
ncbi:type IX secretion system periplasmic lipoprotein PorW/SprE [Amniculibacterium aquaticum]|uniref:type IX secretion system periplasmic lipoprotein PorW/SprE n=1 Tax=Amniculibacterium aquaticum TaxID=2479858 RepID=UPI000F591373|nr:tetratricopeptide repeat protein [Amniculibacterium aquaticum]